MAGNPDFAARGLPVQDRRIECRTLPLARHYQYEAKRQPRDDEANQRAVELTAAKPFSGGTCRLY